ncbi:MAG: FAD-binding oxidoreductase [Candidatus Dormibacterales bacterium]
MANQGVLEGGAVEELRGSARGAVTGPGDEGYEAARAVWNGMVDARPAAVLRCTGAADVMAGMRFAAARGLPLAIRGGGHNVAGFGTCRDGVVLDLGGMPGVRVDPHARLAVVQGGARWGQVDHDTQAFGLATTGGLVSTTGVAGLTLGGGIGWLMREHGLTCDNLVGADVVTAAGELVRAGEDPELLWALRGGGGNFGVVTNFEFRLHPVGPVVTGGAVFHPLDRAREVLSFYEGWAQDAPDQLTTLLVFMTAPPAPFIPPEHQGRKMVAVAACHTGEPGRAAADLKPLKERIPPVVDLMGPIPYAHLQAMFDESAPPGLRSYWKTEYLSGLGEGVVDALVAAAEAMPAGHPAIHVHQLGGAVARGPRDSACFGHRDAPFAANLVGVWEQAAQDASHVAWVRAAAEGLRPFARGGEYLNFSVEGGEEKVRAAFGEEGYQRLRRVKARYDPDNVFRINQNIRPAAGGG